MPIWESVVFAVLDAPCMNRLGIGSPSSFLMKLYGLVRQYLSIPVIFVLIHRQQQLRNNTKRQTKRHRHNTKPKCIHQIRNHRKKQMHIQYNTKRTRTRCIQHKKRNTHTIHNTHRRRNRTNNTTNMRPNQPRPKNNKNTTRQSKTNLIKNDNTKTTTTKIYETYNQYTNECYERDEKLNKATTSY